jgi:hypothetical protein
MYSTIHSLGSSGKSPRGKLEQGQGDAEGDDRMSREMFLTVATGGGIGNLIKLPLGIHPRTGRRSRLLQTEGTPRPDPYSLLRQQQRAASRQQRAAFGSDALKQRALRPQEAES